jgi:hypothetical protein
VPYLLDVLYLFAPLSLALLVGRLSFGGRLELTTVLLAGLASLYVIYALVVAITSLAARRRSGTGPQAVRALAGREAWMLWLFSPLVALFCLAVDLLRKYVTPLFYHRPIDLMLLQPRPVPVTARAKWRDGAEPTARR